MELLPIANDTFWDWKLSYRSTLGAQWTDRSPFFSRDSFVTVISPADVEHMLKTNVDNYVKDAYLQTVFREILGQGVFITNHAWVADGGAIWHQQRKLTSRIFTANNFRSHFMQCFLSHGQELQALLASKVDEPKGLDMQDLFFRFTLDCFGQIGFGTSLGCLEGKKVSPFAQAFDRAQVLVRECACFACIMWLCVC